MRPSAPQPELADDPRHLPVLADAVVAALRPVAGERFLDATCGLGGHAARVLAAGASVVGVDRDPAARAIAGERLAPFAGRFTQRAGTFAAVAAECLLHHEHFHGILMDLGVSSVQLDDHGRGFSIRAEVRADFRMDPTSGEDATDLIDRLDESELADVLFQFGEERRSRRIAKAIKRERAAGGCTTAAELAETVRAAVPGHHPRHPALRTFQALRIAVNDELDELKRMLDLLPDLLLPGGRAVVISFHSLEDRLVKHGFRDQLAAGRLAAIARHPVVADDAELSVNPRASSAKLRWATRHPAPPAPGIQSPVSSLP
ncbi:ribosomal RNA small subunit methyltransferase H [Planctomycetota bacterium]|nr:ribosomal RNA small subunit methyltransferase H [Planctomycetota bacterium]